MTVDAGRGEDTPLWTGLQTHIAFRPRAPAIFAPGLGSFSFEQLGQMLSEMADVLRGAGVDRGDVVAVIQPDGACGLISILAVARVCACCPMDPALSAVEVERDLRQMKVAAIVAEGETGAVMDVAHRLGLAVIVAEARVPLCRWKLLHRGGRSEQSMQTGGAMLLLHTSATTGRRKLVPLTQRNVAAMLEHTLPATRLSQSDRLLLFARHFHIQGIISVIAQLMVGGSVIAPRNLAPSVLYRTLQAFMPTWYTCGPTMHRALLREIVAAKGGVPQSLRFVRSAGAALPAALAEELSATLKVPVLNVYGLSETGGIASTTFDEAPPRGSVGRSLGPEIAVMDGDGRQMECDQEGEIVVRGPAVMHAYLDAGDANHEAFREGWFRTGDLGRMDEQGFLFLTGRIKEMINRGGEKIVPDEIDAVLAQHPAVREVATFGVPHLTLGEDVACAVVVCEGAAVSRAELRGFAQAQLAGFKVPRRIYFRAAIPRGATGKPKRLALREEYARTAEPVQSISPEGDSLTALADHKQVALLWSTLLGCDIVNVDDDFFALGGDSLAAVTMLAGVDTLFGFAVPLSPERFLERSTIAGVMEMLAEAEVDEGDHASGSIVYPINAEGQRGTLFLLPADTNKGLYLRRMARKMSSEWASALVRPAERGPFRPLYAIEDAASEALAAIRAVQPHGPYLIGGYCEGGVIAFEAARRLERLGQRVKLVLFDTPYPGGVHVTRQWQVYSANIQDKMRRARTTVTLEPVTRAAGTVGRKAVWLLLRRVRPLVNRLWRYRWMRELCAWSTHKDFSFYRPGRVRMPILHFLAEEVSSRMRAASRHRWARVTQGTVTTCLLPGDHRTLFDEANLPVLCRVLEPWLGKGT